MRPRLLQLYSIFDHLHHKLLENIRDSPILLDATEAFGSSPDDIIHF